MSEPDILRFRKFTYDDSSRLVTECHQSALDKMQTLYPGKRITFIDELTITIATDSLYSETGFDTYELGQVDDTL